jgi:p24 family protein beta-1
MKMLRSNRRAFRHYGTSTSRRLPFSLDRLVRLFTLNIPMMIMNIGQILVLHSIFEPYHYYNKSRYVVTASVSYTVTIQPYHEQCFILRVPSQTWMSSRQLIGNYEMIDDPEVNNHPDSIPLLVYIMIADATETIIWSKLGSVQDTFQVNLPGGPSAPKRYWMCFQNSRYIPNTHVEEPNHPDDRDRTVGFSYHLVRTEANTISLLWKDQNIAAWNDHSNQVQNDMQTIVDYHQYLKLRESNHRTLVEETFNSVLNWTLIEAGMVILAALGQIFYFRRFLENKTYMR